METPFKINQHVWDNLLNRVDRIDEISIKINSHNEVSIRYSLQNHTGFVDSSDIGELFPLKSIKEAIRVHASHVWSYKSPEDAKMVEANALKAAMDAR